jgi:hypothetical protein
MKVYKADGEDSITPNLPATATNDKTSLRAPLRLSYSLNTRPQINLPPCPLYRSSVTSTVEQTTMRLLLPWL